MDGRTSFAGLEQKVSARAARKISSKQSEVETARMFKHGLAHMFDFGPSPFLVGVVAPVGIVQARLADRYTERPESASRA